jgi:hypothetical protein
LDHSFTRTIEPPRIWPATRSSRRRIAARSPRTIPSRNPAASTSRASARTRSRVSPVASLIATLRRAKKPPTTMTAIAARLASRKRPTAASTRGGRLAALCMRCTIGPLPAVPDGPLRPSSQRRRSHGGWDRSAGSVRASQVSPPERTILMRQRLTAAAAALALALAAVGLIPGSAAARHGADDPAGHVRHARGADDATKAARHGARRGRDGGHRAGHRAGHGADDGAGHVRHARGAGDGPNHR